MFYFKIVFLSVFLVLFGSLAVAGPVVVSTTHPNPDEWYRNTSPVFEIQTTGSGYSFKLDFFPDTIPPPEVMSTDSTVSYSNRTDRIQYFHARVKSGGVWSDTTHFKIQIDRTKPFPPQKPVAEFLEDGTIKLTWEHAIDEQSGIDGYKIYRSFLRDFDIQFDPFEIVAEKVEGTSFIDTGVEVSLAHHYRLQSIDKVGNVGGITNSFTAFVSAKCDFNAAIETSFEDGNLFLRMDSSPHIMFFAKLVLKPEQGGEIVVFSNRSNEDLFVETVDLSGLPDQRILIDFDVKDRNNDVCDTEKTFFLDRIAPSGQWVAPKENSSLKETVTLTVSAFDEGQNPSGVELVELFYEDVELVKIGDAQEFGVAEFSLDWNSLSAPNGRFYLVTKIFDRAKNVAEKKVIVTIYNTAIISAQAVGEIEKAKEKRQSLKELEDQIKLLGISVEDFFSNLASADSNLFKAQELLEKGVNFELAKENAVNAFESYELLFEIISIEKTDSLNFVLQEPKSAFQKAGLSPNLISQAQEAFDLYLPVRRLDIFKVVDGNKTFYKQVILLTITGNNYQNDKVQVIEIIPKELAENAAEILSSYDFEVLNIDPVVKFVVDLNQTKRVSYAFKGELSKTEVDGLLAENPLKHFKSAPIVLSAQTIVDQSIVMEPFDLFKVIEPFTSKYDSFSLLLFGLAAFAVLFAIIGIISFFVLVVAVLKSR